MPTSNYLQQWTGELCYKSIGLRLSPEMVFAGTPNQLERFQKRTGSHPAILLMTYTALSQAGSAIGKGGFDIDSIEMFLQGANVQYVILDEVHKVAENLKSVSSDVIRLMLEWLHDGSLQRLIGFTGTAEAYRSRFEQAGPATGLQHPHRRADRRRLCRSICRAGHAVLLFGARAAHPRPARQLQGTAPRIHGAGGRRTAAQPGSPKSPWTSASPSGTTCSTCTRAVKTGSPALPKRLADWEIGGQPGAD